jgi:hypothetical protein
MKEESAPAPAKANEPRLETQVHFASPAGMRVAWFAKDATDKETNSPREFIVPGHAHLLQGTTYRLKLTNIPGKPGLEVYPTLEVMAPNNRRAAEFLAQNAVSLRFDEDDFDKVRASNAFVKVVYLPTESFLSGGPIVPRELRATKAESRVNAILDDSDVLLIVRFGGMNP